MHMPRRRWYQGLKLRPAMEQLELADKARLLSGEKGQPAAIRPAGVRNC
jgi:hypothetical protein